MTQTTNLRLGSLNGHVTVDGTDSNGNPWIVGDALAAAAGKQDTFPTVVDLANITRFSVEGPSNSIVGLAINNTIPTPAATPNGSLIYDPLGSTNTTIKNTRLDGGAGNLGPCSPPSCNPTSNLVSITETGVAISNVEARSAYGYGIQLPAAATPTPAQITDSWIHNNFNDNLYVTDASMSRNIVELAGFNVAPTPTPVNPNADGIHGNGVSNISTSRNLVRDNQNNGIEVTAFSVSPALSLAHDYVCGSGGYYNVSQGIYVWGASNGVVNGTGLTSAYNTNSGVYLDASILSGSTLTFNNDSAFTANGPANPTPVPGFVNASTVTASATGNQWRGVTNGLCHSSPDVSGPVNCDPVQDGPNVPILLSSSDPDVPSNVLVKGQTIRVQGKGFNAIDGNPLAGSMCSVGPGSTSSNCCRNTSKANACDTTVSPPQGKAGQGNCTALKNEVGNWIVTFPTAVTPTTIVTSLQANFGCIGNYGEQVSVSKIDGSGHNVSNQQAYCTNVNPK